MTTTQTVQATSDVPPEPIAGTGWASYEEAIFAVARMHGFRISLNDHRGRQFAYDFYVDSGPATGRLGVWAFSASGASKLVAWPKGRGRGPNGNRVRNGWGSWKSAQRVASLLREAASAWCVQNGAVPKPKAKREKKRK